MAHASHFPTLLSAGPDGLPSSRQARGLHRLTPPPGGGARGAAERVHPSDSLIPLAQPLGVRRVERVGVPYGGRETSRRVGQWRWRRQRRREPAGSHGGARATRFSRGWRPRRIPADVIFRHLRRCCWPLRTRRYGHGLGEGRGS
jgi:hypothetical protein